MAHDFNTLLQVIRGSVTLLPLVEPGGGRFQRALHAIQHSASRGAKLTHQPLAFGRRLRSPPAPSTSGVRSTRCTSCCSSPCASRSD
ncbi:hypothetical protein [Telluria aromaticivorans]|uniref:hypothetical protein n=1 Tax=Telluria aromaticivorans TaxID=2725995 RepID=UPI003531494A